MKEFLKYSLKGWLISFTIAVMIVFILKTFIGMPTTVKGTSMSKTLYPDDKLFLSTWGANFNTIPSRGDIITFEAPSVEELNHEKSSIAIYSKDSKSVTDKILYYGLGISKASYIKRVIGLPGEHIQIKKGNVYINDKLYKEYYLGDNVKTDMSLGGEFDDIVVPDNCVFVLGDNRSASIDSRKFGCIPVSKIEGKVLGRWWPIEKLGAV